MNYSSYISIVFFFFNDTATTEIYTLSLHDALPIYVAGHLWHIRYPVNGLGGRTVDRKSTRLNSSHGYISYAVFCLKKKKNIKYTHRSKSDKQIKKHTMNDAQHR